jgi:hypothetical protein
MSLNQDIISRSPIFDINEFSTRIMASRNMATAIRTSRMITRQGRIAPRFVRTVVTAKPAHAAVTQSIGKTKGVDGPEISSYPAPKHLKVPSGLTPQQACPNETILMTD